MALSLKTVYRTVLPPDGRHARRHTPLSPFGLQNEKRTIQKGLSVFRGGDNGARTRDLLTARLI